MRHRVAGRHLGRETSHRRALYRNLVTDFLRYERITTTEAKAKEIRPMAERIITLAKRGDLPARRQALKFVYDPKVVKKTFDEIGPRMARRHGGYTRITALEQRKGDGARMAVLELVDYAGAAATPAPPPPPPAPPPPVAAVAPEAAPPRRRRSRAAAAPAAEAPEAVETSDTVEATAEAVPEAEELPGEGETAAADEEASKE